MTAPLDTAQQTPARVQPLVRSASSESHRALRARFQRDGYLHFPRHVSPDKCAALQHYWARYPNITSRLVHAD